MAGLAKGLFTHAPRWGQSSRRRCRSGEAARNPSRPSSLRREACGGLKEFDGEAETDGRRDDLARRRQDLVDTRVVARTTDARSPIARDRWTRVFLSWMTRATAIGWPDLGGCAMRTFDIHLLVSCVARTRWTPPGGELHPFKRGTGRNSTRPTAGAPSRRACLGWTCGKPCRPEMPKWGRLLQERSDLN